MKLKFLGTGASIDYDVATSSVFVDSDTKLMIDAGYTSMMNFFKLAFGKTNYLDAIFLSHKHGDHTLGLVPYLLSNIPVEKNRTKELTIIGFPGVEKYVTQLYEMCFKEFPYNFKINFHEFPKPLQLNELKLTFAEGKHTDFGRTWAIKVFDGNHSFVYATDTVYSKEVLELAKGVDILIHDCSFATYKSSVHSNVEDCIKLFQESEAKKIYLTHIYSKERQKVKQLAEQHENVFVPRDGDEIEL